MPSKYTCQKIGLSARFDARPDLCVVAIANDAPAHAIALLVHIQTVPALRAELAIEAGTITSHIKRPRVPEEQPLARGSLSFALALKEDVGCRSGLTVDAIDAPTFFGELVHSSSDRRPTRMRTRVDPVVSTTRKLSTIATQAIV